MKQIMDQALKVTIGTRRTFNNMTVFPVIGGQVIAADYLTLDEARASRPRPKSKQRRPPACGADRP
jgi:hypothetical protein